MIFSVSRIISIILNKGGMSDVAKAYLNYFQVPKDAYLFVFYDMRIFTPFESDRIIFFNDPNLYNFSKTEQLQKLVACVHEKVKAIGGKKVVCDFHTYRYFEGLPVEIIADVHYLIKYANSLPRPSHELYDENIPINIQLRFSREEALKGKYEQEMLKASSKIIANSDYTASLLQNNYQIEANKIATIPVSPVLAPSAKRIDIKNANKSILYHGRFNIHKRVDYLIHLGHCIDEEIFLYGATESTKIKAEKLAGKNTVVELWNTNIDSVISESVFHIFPSHYEPWGLALTKSMAAGGICIANKNGRGHCEQIDDGVNGFLLDFEGEDWVEKVKNILSLSEIQLLEISIAAQKKAQALCLGEYCKKILDLI